jgi:hypothetical protein
MTGESKYRVPAIFSDAANTRNHIRLRRVLTIPSRTADRKPKASRPIMFNA